MDLRDGRISMDELLADPTARRIIEEELPGLLNSPLVPMVRRMTLAQVLSLAAGRLPPAKQARILERLRDPDTPPA